MSELESSGLLERDSAQPPAHDGTEPATKTDPSTDTSARLQDGQQDNATAEPNLAAAIVDAVNDVTAAAPKQQDLSSLSEQDAAVLANADVAPSEPAEQRVLGDMDGAPGWCEVRSSSLQSTNSFLQYTQVYPGGHSRSSLSRSL